LPSSSTGRFGDRSSETKEKPMTQAQHTHSTTTAFAPAAVAALVMAAVLAIGIVLNGGVPTPNISTDSDRITTDPAVLQSGRDWETQRRQQSGETYRTFDQKVIDARGW
jgi:hypothetical protein